MSSYGEASVGQGGAQGKIANSFANAGSLQIRGGAGLVSPHGTTPAVNSNASNALTASSLVNQGSLTVRGSLDGSAQTRVNVNGAASAVSGDWLLQGRASINYASGQIGAIQYGASLELDGANAAITSAGSSAVSGLAVNAGRLTLKGDASGGVTLQTAPGLINSGVLYVDADVASGGGAVGVAGTLTNSGQIYVGNLLLSAATSLSVGALVNQGALYVQGGPGGAGTLVTVHQAAAGALTGLTVLSGKATLAYDSGGFISVQAGAVLNLIGTDAQVLAGGVSALSGLKTNYGFVDLESEGGALALTLNQGFANYANLQLDANGAVAAGRTVTFQSPGGVLGLNDPGAFAAAIQGFGGSDAIDLLGATVSSFAYSGSAGAGTLTLQTSAGVDVLRFVGSYSTASFATMSDGAGGMKILAA